MSKALPDPRDIIKLDATMGTLEEVQEYLTEKGAHGLAGDVRVARATLMMGLEIWDEYLSQIGRCVSQDYGRLNVFPMYCEKLGVKLDQ